MPMAFAAEFRIPTPVEPWPLVETFLRRYSVAKPQTAPLACLTRPDTALRIWKPVWVLSEGGSMRWYAVRCIFEMRMGPSWTPRSDGFHEYEERITLWHAR